MLFSTALTGDEMFDMMGGDVESSLETSPCHLNITILILNKSWINYIKQNKAEDMNLHLQGVHNESMFRESYLIHPVQHSSHFNKQPNTMGDNLVPFTITS